MTEEVTQLLLERHGEMVWRLCRRLAGEDCEDLFQETFLRAMSADVERPWDESARNLLYTICLNTYRTWYAKSRRRGLVTQPMPEAFEVPAPEDTAGDALREMAAQAARAAVARLPDKYRIPIEMHYFAGWQAAQIARALGVRENSARSLLHRARKKLEKDLEGWL